MPFTSLSKIPYPSGSDAPAAAADMMAMLAVMDDRLVLKAVDAADRDARYGDATTGSVCTAVTEPTETTDLSCIVWVKTGAGPADWTEIYSDTGWISTGFSYQSGWGAGTYAKSRRVGKMCEVRVRMIRTGEDITASATGHLPDVNVVSVPPHLRPNDGDYVTFPARSYLTTGTCSLYSNAMVTLTDLHPNSTISTGDFFQFSHTFTLDRI